MFIFRGLPPPDNFVHIDDDLRAGQVQGRLVLANVVEVYMYKDTKRVCRDKEFDDIASPSRYCHYRHHCKKRGFAFTKRCIIVHCWSKTGGMAAVLSPRFHVLQT
jgi:hypothetical protein